MNKTLEVIGQAIFKKWFIDEKKENLEIRKFGDLIKRNKEQIQNKESWDNEYLIDLSNMPQFSMSIVNFDKGSKFSSNIFKLNEYDILFGSIRPYFGKYGFSPINGVITGTIFSFLPKDKDDYAFCLFNICRKEFVEYTVAQSKGTKMPIIGWSEFQNYTVKYNKVLSKKFNDLIFPLIKEIKLNINQNQTLSSIRDALLPKLMSGEIRVK
jgi:type I restriction enzyme S subunit